MTSTTFANCAAALVVWYRISDPVKEGTAAAQHCFALIAARVKTVKGG